MQKQKHDEFNSQLRERGLSATTSAPSPDNMSLHSIVSS